jgi:hypothetical protein
VRDEILKIRHLLSRPEKWTKGSDARDIKGRVVGANTIDAYCYCLNGAIDRILRYSESSASPLSTETQSIFDKKIKIEEHILTVAHSVIDFPEDKTIISLNDKVLARPIYGHSKLIEILDLAAEKADPLCKYDAPAS